MYAFCLGLLAAVGNLTVHSQRSSILLTWIPPFSLDITGVHPDLWYCVEVYNISQGRAQLTTNCSVYEPQFYFTTPNHSPCDLFEFRVFTVNQVGNGSVTSVNKTFDKSKWYSPDILTLTLHWMLIFCSSQPMHRTSSWWHYSGRILFNPGNQS